MTFYFGACAGGVWKTTDGGSYWENVSDGFFQTAAVGAIAVAESDPNVVYAGTGEACIRGNVAHGDGVYRSTDGGKTWTNVGLQDTRHIARVRVHPRDPDTVYVAALGHAFGPNEERGVFRSKDGGQSWERVLFRSENAGAADLTMDPNNPRILYAAIWQARRSPWGFDSGGPDSGLYKSSDGGDTWTELTDNPGMAKGLKGRIGVSVSPARAGRVWAVVEASREERGLYRSDDGGATWERINEDGDLVQRPWYYSHVFADPQDPETVYVMNLKAWKSTDGGKTFTQVSTPHGDNHELWIDPRNTRRMIQGNDGGACVSFNGGDTWTTIFNQPTGQFYHVATDTQFPYRVYGTQQDNSAVSVPSRSAHGAILWGECYPVGTSESGHIAVRPDNPNIVYSGAIGSSAGGGDSLLRYDHSTGQTRIVSVWPEYYWGWGVKDHRYRFQWTYPIVISPHDPNILFVTGNIVFRSDNDGTSWEAVSPDLTRNDVTKMEAAGGPITLDTTFVENYGTIFALTESSHEAGVLWAGSDDGLVHVSKDGGGNWANVTPSDIPEWTRIDVIEVSPHQPSAAYISATRYKHDDVRPFLYRTKDFGATWEKIVDGIPEDDFTRVIREDTERPGLLYAGTETGIYVSFDDGETWQSLRCNLPTVPVTDLAVRGNELVASTNGRGFWILGDLTVLRQCGAEVGDADVYLFEPAATYRFPASRSRQVASGKNYSLGLGVAGTFYEKKTPDGETVRVLLDAGTNPPDGAVVTYLLKNEAEGEATLTFLDPEGNTIKSFVPGSDDPKSGNEEPSIPVKAGMNRFVWDLRYPDARKVEIEGARDKGLAGPLAPPGTYSVRLTVGDETQTQSFDIVMDPRIDATQAELEAQHALLIRNRDKLSECHGAINRLMSVRRQVDEWVRRSVAHGSPESVSETAGKLKDKLSAIEGELIQLRAVGDLDTISHPAQLNAKLAELTFVPAHADFGPTRQSHDVFEDLSTRTDTQIQLLDKVIEEDLPVFVDLLHELEVPAIVQEVAG
jgi:photosystem II stability/assembly factor-like uncharacterized protein